MITLSLCICKITVALWGTWNGLGTSGVYEDLAIFPLQEILGHGKSLSTSTALFFRVPFTL